MPIQATNGEHIDLHRRSGTYAGFPLIEALGDGRLAVAFLSNDENIRDHYGFGEWRVLTSTDSGATWTSASSNDLSIPFNWPSSSHRERYDRFSGKMPDGTLVAAGAVGFEEWPATRAKEAEDSGRRVSPHPLKGTSTVAVGGNRLFTQRSRDGGQTWERQERQVPGSHRLSGFPRWVKLMDGTIMAPLYDGGAEGASHNKLMVYRSTDDGVSWQLRLVGTGASVGGGDEAALVETESGLVLCLIRSAPGPLLECWSDDAGKTWSHAVQTDISGYPPHLLKLRDGRILCSFGHRKTPLGIQAVLSSDGGRSWDIENRVILRDDSETWDLGYPISVQLADESILTVYYITISGMTHVAASRWALPW